MSQTLTPADPKQPGRSKRTPAERASGRDPRKFGAAPPASYGPQELVVSQFDKVSSLLLAFAMFLGILVGLVFLLWLTSGKPPTIEVYPEIIENPAGRGENAEGFERDFEPPGAEEVEDLMEPTVEDTLQAVTDAVSSVPASFEAVDSDVSANSAGAGQGDSRRAGPMGEGDDIIPRFERWKLKFAAKNLNAYAAQLDFYQIELAAIGGTIQGVDYAASVSTAPATRRGPSEGEERLYFMWTTPGPLMKYDQQLLQKAGINLSGRELLKFIPSNLENMLANIELDYAKAKGHNSVKEIAETIFESQGSDGAYKFEVISQKYRVPQKH